MDPYAPCPCGSGKKLKFCCQEIAGEMEKIERLQENNQPRMALQLLEKIEKSHPANPWIAIHKGLALIDDQRSDEAAACLLAYLHTDPNHPFANAIYGIASYNAEGYPAAKKAIHRAFRKSIRDFPGLVAPLAGSLATEFMSDARYMAGREHFALALRIGSQEQQRQTLMALLDFDGESSIPYPMRGPHHLPQLESTGVNTDAVHKVRALAACACFQEAADLLTQTAGDDAPGEVRHAIGLLRAWDGDESAAAAELHRAGELYDDFEKAVDCETVAQLLDQFSDENTAKLRLRRYQVESVSRLLTVLDSTPRVVRVDQLEQSEKRAGDPVARYLILDRDVPDESALGELNRESAPLAVARISIFDRSEDFPAYVYLSGLEGETLEQAAELLTAAAGELINHIAGEDDDETDDAGDELAGVVPREQLPYYRNFFVPPKTPGPVRRRIQLGHWESIVQDEWINTPIRALGDRSPQDAAGDPSARVKLAAAVNVLDVFCGTRGYICPVAEVRQRLGLPEPHLLQWTEGLNLNILSLMEVQRIDLSSLPDENLRSVVQRAMLVHHPSHLYGVLRYVLNERTANEETPDPSELCITLVDLCRDSLRREEALQWAERGREFARGGPDEFEAMLQWKMRELMLRIDDPDDPQRDTLLLDMWQTYGVKIPSLREHLMQLVSVLGIEPPWDTGILTPAAGAATQGAWTASDSGAAGGEKKLWLPGDD